jgi:two-component sensor histidine kinase/sulfur relay (sulfurtransferase) DsrC/TusE family protein
MPVAARIPLRHEAAQSLALALVQSSNAPIVLLDDHLKVIEASASFFRAFQIDAATVRGKTLSRLGEGEWNVQQLTALLKATLAGHAEIEAYEMDLERAARTPRRLVLNAQKLDYGDADGVRLLLTIADVTDARVAEKLKDDLLREKAILLQELHHRVANSLQIIAAVLLQSARRVKSEETRNHLYDAHNRVMSVAGVQQQLAASRLGEVHLRAYFTELCNSLSASMIRDRDQLSLGVEADGSVIDADVSVSLGLIVTELVINALKHAFPDHRAGKIKVGYASKGTDWALSVSDNGVGMPADAASAKPGLGTSIVEALARQLDAKVRIANGRPGTSVSIVHG